MGLRTVDLGDFRCLRPQTAAKPLSGANARPHANNKAVVEHAECACRVDTASLHDDPWAHDQRHINANMARGTGRRG